MDDTLPFKLVSDLCKWRTTTDHCNKLTDKPEKCHRRICPIIKEARAIYQGPGVGMPAALLLDEFGSQVWSAFGSPPYLVGSALAGKKWRDVDVRLILSDEEYRPWVLVTPVTSIVMQNGSHMCWLFQLWEKQ